MREFLSLRTKGHVMRRALRAKKWAKKTKPREREDSKQTAAVSPFMLQQEQKGDGKRGEENLNLPTYSRQLRNRQCSHETRKTKKKNCQKERKMFGILWDRHMDVPCSVPFPSSPQGAKEGDAARFDLGAVHQSRTPSGPRPLMQPYIYCSFTEAKPCSKNKQRPSESPIKGLQMKNIHTYIQRVMSR